MSEEKVEKPKLVKTAAPKKEEAKSSTKKWIAAVRIRGIINLDSTQSRTFDLLHLHKKNWCVLLKDTPSTKGMLQKIKDFITWGEIPDDLAKDVVDKRAELFKERTEDSKKHIKYRYFEFAGKKYKPYIRLEPPKKGFGRKGVKVPFSRGGALGYRAAEMADLIRRMI